MTGFSARLTGGGTGLTSLTSRSLLNSPDLRGGGGEGGCDGVNRGDFRGSRTGVRGSKTGVWGRLGILKILGPVEGDTGLIRESVCKNPGLSPPGTSADLLGGDCGGSTSRDGGWTGRGLTAGRMGRVGESGLLAFAAACRLPRFSLSLGRILGTAGSSRTAGEPVSLRRSGFDAGEMGLGGGRPGVCVSPDLFMFSNWARSEDTGFCETRVSTGCSRASPFHLWCSQWRSRQARQAAADPWRRRASASSRLWDAVPMPRPTGSLAHEIPQGEPDVVVVVEEADNEGYDLRSGQILCISCGVGSLIRRIPQQFWRGRIDAGMEDDDCWPPGQL